MDRDSKKLQEDVAGKYEVLKGHGVGEYHFSGHVVHLDRINLERAEELVKLGFPYLVEKQAVAGTKKPLT